MKQLIVSMALLMAGAAHAGPVADFTHGKQYLGLQQPSTQEQRDRNWAPEVNRVVHYVRPADADPAVTHYLRDNIAAFRRDLVTPASPLVIWLPGTGGAPDHSKLLFGTIADQGYRVLGLMYDDMPATGQVCQHDTDPTCAGRLRAKRIFGEETTADIDDPAHETVVARLVAALRYLDAHYPGEGWGAYLDAGGTPVWSRLIVAGHSQGAGIAAFIAKRYEVARVALFSSPWDYYHASVDGQDTRVISPWINGPSATPAYHWYGLFHAREPQARNILRAYRALRVPPSHIRVLQLDPRKHGSAHGSVSSDFTTPLDQGGKPAYSGDWRFVFGGVNP